MHRRGMHKGERDEQRGERRTEGRGYREWACRGEEMHKVRTHRGREMGRGKKWAEKKIRSQRGKLQDKIDVIGKTTTW